MAIVIMLEGSNTMSCSHCLPGLDYLRSLEQAWRSHDHPENLGAKRLAMECREVLEKWAQVSKQREEGYK